MTKLNRRSFIAAAGAAAAVLPLSGNAFAQEKIKIGFVFLGPIGDYGWTWAHNKGREAVNAALGDKVETIYVENVAEDASAIPVLRDLAQQGCKLIFGTTYGYMDQMVQVAAEFPDVKFEHCTGFKRADNVATYNSKFHEGRAVLGTIAGKMSKSGTLGYLGSYKVPEVVLGVNSFMLAAQKQNPDANAQAGVHRQLVRSAEGSRRHRDAAQPRLRYRHHPHRQPGRAADPRAEGPVRLRPGRRHVELSRRTRT